jgi:signal-induced proliferation-associated 1 like protein 3
MIPPPHFPIGIAVVVAAVVIPRIPWWVPIAVVAVPIAVVPIPVIPIPVVPIPVVPIPIIPAVVPTPAAIVIRGCLLLLLMK